MKQETFIQSNGMPRTKGIRNSNIAAARSRRGGFHGDKRTRRSGNKGRNWKQEDWT